MKMHESQDPVVASLASRSAHPYSSVAMSNNRRHAICAGKDTLQLMEVSPRGLTLIRSLRISQHFQTAMSAENAQMAKIYEDKTRGSFLRDNFGLIAKQAPPNHQNMSNVNVVITDVAWSKPQTHRRDNNTNAPEMMMDDNVHQESAVGRVVQTTHHNKKQESVLLDSLVAAAGSNGVVVVWSARRAFFEGDASAMANQQPEAILGQHSRAVNRLAWHPRRPGLLLTASQVCLHSLVALQAILRLSHLG